VSGLHDKNLIEKNGTPELQDFAKHFNNLYQETLKISHLSSM
jgi:hypothetical protein